METHSIRASLRESDELLGDDLDSKTRGDTQASIDLPEEDELEQLPDRFGTAPRRLLAISTLFGDLGGELVGGGGLSEKMVASIEFCVSCPLDQPLSQVVVVVATDDVVVLTEYVDIVLLDVDTLPVLFSLRRFSNSMFCEVISIVALLSRKKSSPVIGSEPLISRSCF